MTWETPDFVDLRFGFEVTKVGRNQVFSGSFVLLVSLVNNATSDGGV